MAEVGAPVSLDGVTVHPDYCWCVCLCYLHFADGEQRYNIWVCKQEVEKPSRNARAQGYVNEDLKADALQKGWGFRVGSWNVDSPTSKAGEVVQDVR